MELKWFGAVLIITGCSGLGLSLASDHRRQETMIRGLIKVLEYMECELKYRLTPLPELCFHAAQETSGILKNIFTSLSEELSLSQVGDLSECMSKILKNNAISYGQVREILTELGSSLGRFDLSGQLQDLARVHAMCAAAMDNLARNRDERLRCYRTLGVCAGIALVILFV